MKIHMPPLPPNPIITYVFEIGNLESQPVYAGFSAEMVRAIQREAMLAALEAVATWYNDEGREHCRSDVAAEIRALEIAP